MPDSREAAVQALQEHDRSREELHRKLSALPGADTEKLKHAIAQHQKAAKAFQDDALECWKA